jgi:hypothetical protein
MESKGKKPCVICGSVRYARVNAEGVCAGCETAMKKQERIEANKRQRMILKNLKNS